MARHPSPSKADYEYSVKSAQDSTGQQSGTNVEQTAREILQWEYFDDTISDKDIKEAVDTKPP